MNDRLWRMRKRFDCVVSDDMQVIQKNRLFSFTTTLSWCTHVVSNTSKSNIDDNGGNRNRCHSMQCITKCIHDTDQDGRQN